MLLPLPRRRAIVALCCLFAVAGCSSVQLGGERQIGGNRYLLEEPYSSARPYEDAVAALDRRAKSTCEQGYRKVNDYDRFRESGNLLIWDIVCRGKFKEFEGGSLERPVNP